MGRQDEGRLFSSPATDRNFARVRKCASVPVYHLLCAGKVSVIWHVDIFVFLHVCLCLCVAELGLFLPATHFPQTVLSSIHSVLLKVTLLLASGDDSMLSWLVDLCHLVLALRG